MITVERHSFFRSAPDYHNYRFSEVAPECVHKKSMECGCTSSVDVRPDGKPHQVNQEVILSHDSHGPVSFRFSSLWLTFGDMGRDGHSYFRFSPTEHSVHVEITLPGYGYVGYFFVHLHMGQKIDTSNLMNGHSPSRVINLDAIGPTDLWMHDCNFGDEAFKTLDECAETEMWREIFSDVQNIRFHASKYLTDEITPVSVIRTLAEADSKLIDTADSVASRLWPIASELEKTELFHVGDELHRRVHKGVDPWNITNVLKS